MPIDSLNELLNTEVLTYDYSIAGNSYVTFLLEPDNSTHYTIGVIGFNASNTEIFTECALVTDTGKISVLLRNVNSSTASGTFRAIALKAKK